MAGLKVSLGEVYSDFRAMLLAYHLACEGQGFVEPNPAVGCVILNSKNELIGFGYHQTFGEAHAEVNAVNSVHDKSQLAGARVFVTLEPCGHTGKTPPCADLLLGHKIGELIYAVSDPNPKFNHRGLNILKEGGVKVSQFKQSPDLVQKMESLVEVHLHKMNHNTSYVAQKLASSLDGQIALKNGESQWITGKESRKYTHFLRATHDAILVGVNTLLTDNPSLNIRHEKFVDKKNKVIVLDPQLRCKNFLKDSKLLKVHALQDVLIACDKKRVKDNSDIPCELLPVVVDGEGNIDLRQLLELTKEKGISSILVEGGAFTHSSFISQQVSQRIYAFLAPCIIGGSRGLSWSHNVSTASLKEKKKLAQPEIVKLGADILYKTKFLP